MKKINKIALFYNNYRGYYLLQKLKKQKKSDSYFFQRTDKDSKINSIKILKPEPKVKKLILKNSKKLCVV